MSTRRPFVTTTNGQLCLSSALDSDQRGFLVTKRLIEKHCYYCKYTGHWKEYGTSLRDILDKRESPCCHPQMTWAKTKALLDVVVTDIVNSQTPKSTRVAALSIAEDLVYHTSTQNDPYNHSSSLYIFFTSFLDKLATETDAPKFERMCRRILPVFGYIDQYYIRRRSLPTLDETIVQMSIKKSLITDYVTMAERDTTHSIESLLLLENDELSAMVEGHPAKVYPREYLGRIRRRTRILAMNDTTL